MTIERENFIEQTEKLKDEMQIDTANRENQQRKAKQLDKIFMAQRSKGRMALDHWNAWLKGKKNEDLQNEIERARLEKERSARIKRLSDLLLNINNNASKGPLTAFLQWKNYAKDHIIVEKEKISKIRKAFEKIFMAQRSKGRMALDQWAAWAKSQQITKLLEDIEKH